jgi:hypothetical protein
MSKGIVSYSIGTIFSMPPDPAPADRPSLVPPLRCAKSRSVPQKTIKQASNRVTVTLLPQVFNGFHLPVDLVKVFSYFVENSNQRRGERGTNPWKSITYVIILYIWNDSW